MKLSLWAKKEGIHYNTAYRWYREGTMPVRAWKSESNSIFVEDSKILFKTQPKVAVYCRVSSHNKKDDLTRQVQRCLDFCSAKGYNVEKVYKEIASGMNDNRKEFWKMLDASPTIIVVENKDRLTRFGFNYIKNLTAKLGCAIDVINPAVEDEQDLIKDMISIVTSFCCRLYGARRGQNKVKEFRKTLDAT